MKLNVAALALTNLHYRRVLATGTDSQIVAMALYPGEEVALETHATDQIVTVVSGVLHASTSGLTEMLHADETLLIRAGTPHRLWNASTSKVVQLYTIYADVLHAPDTLEWKPAAD